MSESPPDEPASITLAEPVAALAALFSADYAEHSAVPPVGTPEYAALRARDRERRTRAVALLDRLRAIGAPAPEALYHTAWLLNHSDDSDEVRLAHNLAREAAEHGFSPARWLAAAAYDRSCMYEGRPQKYGTQFVPDGVRYRLWDVEPATTDAERAAWDVPLLAQQLQRAEAMTRTNPQPPLDGAPAWLADAVARWRAQAEGESEKMRRWIGRWIVGVGILHAALGFIIFRRPLLAILHDGVWNAVDGHPGRPLAFWFVFVGLFAILFGSLVDSMEGRDLPLSHFVSWAFFMLLVLAIVTMPMGGGWLLLPAALGLVVRSYHRGTRPWPTATD